MKKILTILTLCAITVCSCKKEISGISEGNVYLRLNSDYDLELSSKAGDTATPAPDDFLIEIKHSNGEEAKSGTYGTLKEPFQLPSETGYTITAQNIDEASAHSLNEGRGELRLYGASSFDVAPGRPTEVAFTCTVANARFSVDFTEDFKTMFKAAYVAVTENTASDRTVPAFDINSTIATDWTYFNIDGDPEVTVKIDATRNDDTVISSSQTVSIEAGKWYRITYNSEVLGQGDIEITVDDEIISAETDINVDPYEKMSITIPEQYDYNVWSNRVIINPVTEADIVYEENKDAVMQNLVYEVSSDLATWIAAEKQEDGTFIANGLQPATSYILRVRYSELLSANTWSFTTEACSQLSESGFENWETQKLNTTWRSIGFTGLDVNQYNPTGTSSIWKTNNSESVGGAASPAGSVVMWRYHSVVIPSSVAAGNNAAELSTMRFYNQSANSLGWSRNSINSSVSEDGTNIFGTIQTDAVSFSSRPASMSFDYKFSSYPAGGDKAVAYAVLYDSNSIEIARTAEFASADASSFTNMSLDFNYSDLTEKAAFVKVYFQSGQITDMSGVSQVNGEYNATPYSDDRFIGSVFTVDNVVFNY